ncbi:MAG: hypothetical protein FH748_06090 [Balneolaceae bacterium]|nr:hypothetical protein [Balneolaceae bacterium]
MQKKYTTFLLGILLSVFGVQNLFAQTQTNPDYDLEYRKWRITLFPPLSTNGVEAPAYTARYSINLLWGYHGGLDGAEIGGLVNYNKHYAHGFQLAGLANATGGDMLGLNIAGLANIAHNDISGVQGAGLFNYAGNELQGIQAAGLLNFSKESSSGIQFAGIGNSSTGDLEGLQFSGVFNTSWEDISGVQGSGAFNMARGSVEGLQVTGGLNFAGEEISGLQVAGLGNIAMDDIEGLMVSSAFNFAGKDGSGLLISGGINYANNLEGVVISGGANIARELEGLQFAGILNASKKATGLQIGLINYAEEFEGVPIGMISLYGNGRKNFDVRYSDGGFTDIGITLGTYRVYNTALFGYNTLLDRDVYRLGLAVGLEKNISDSFERLSSETLFVNQEISYLHHFEEDFSRKTNAIWSYKFLVGNRFASGFSMYAGPSFNMQVSRVSEASDYTWYSLWSPEWKGRQYRFWAGFTVGIRLFKQKKMKPFREVIHNWDNGKPDWEIEW